VEIVMLDDVRFDLQALDFRALSEREWAELKVRLERRARAERSAAIEAMTAAAFTWLGRWSGRLTSAVAREWQAYRIAHMRRAAMKQLNSLDDRDLKDIGLRRCEIYTAVYRHDARRMR
jgi:uncharacterized protein YjiS (DUF1127 family)